MFFFFLCELCIVIVNVHMITLQLLLDDQFLFGLGPKAKQSRFISNCKHIQSSKIKHFHAYLKYPVHRNPFIGKNKTLFVRFDLTSSILQVLRLTHCTTADHIFVLQLL